MFLSSGKISPLTTFSVYSLLTRSRLLGRQVKGTDLVMVDLLAQPLPHSTMGI